MKPGETTVRPTERALLTLCCTILLLVESGAAQNTPYARTFAQSKARVEKALKELQPSSAGRLPVVDGFTVPGDRPLGRFQRGYYQCTVQLSSTPSGGSLVRVSAKITAWYADPVSSKSGYQVLPSNGRLEADFLDRLEEKLEGHEASSTANVPASFPPSRTTNKPDASAPALSAPMPDGSAPSGPLATSKGAAAPANSPFKLASPASQGQVASLATQRAVADKHVEELTKQAKNLEEILRNQTHPNNLVAVKKSGTPVLLNPSEGAKVVFLATAEDEFEILDMTASWVHVRISGLSRGWIRRSGLEMPGTATVTQAGKAPAASGVDSASAKPFQVESEQIASFPGTWEPLRGRTVKIVSVQKSSGSAPNSDSRAKLDFAKSLFDHEYTELVQSSISAAGVVLIFDSEDGGMVATTLPVLEQWKAGSLSDDGLWRRCLFDPPEMFSPYAQ